jgi:hypothetical protein
MKTSQAFPRSIDFNTEFYDDWFNGQNAYDDQTTFIPAALFKDTAQAFKTGPIHPASTST